jgi:dephospho-CoA kinase
MSLEQKLVVAVVAHTGAGKETFTGLLTEDAKPLSVKPMTFSAVLGDILKRIHLPRNRNNYQKLSATLRETFPDFLAIAIRGDIEETKESIIVLDGPRWPEDIAMLRSLPNNVLVFLEATTENRFFRIKERKVAGKEGEDKLTWEEFLVQENAPNEAYVDGFKTQADFVIDNNGNLDDLRKQVEDLWNNHLKSRV